MESKIDHKLLLLKSEIPNKIHTEINIVMK